LNAKAVSCLNSEDAGILADTAKDGNVPCDHAGDQSMTRVYRNCRERTAIPAVRSDQLKTNPLGVLIGGHNGIENDRVDWIDEVELPLRNARTFSVVDDDLKVSRREDREATSEVQLPVL